MVGSKFVMSNKDLVAMLVKVFKDVNVSFDSGDTTPGTFKAFVEQMGMDPSSFSKLRKVEGYEQQFFALHGASMGYLGVLVALAKLPNAPKQLIPLLQMGKALVDGVLELFVLNLLEEFSSKDSDIKYVPTLLQDENGEVWWYKAPYLPDILKNSPVSGEVIQ